MGIGRSLSDSVILAEQAWRAAEHILNVTFPVVQDPKLLLRALEHLNKAARDTISAVLRVEYIHERIKLVKGGSENLGLFFSECTDRYKMSKEDVKLLSELLELGEKHKRSGTEFSQKGKMIILDDETGSVTVSCQGLQAISGALRRLQLQLQEELKAQN